MRKHTKYIKWAVTVAVAFISCAAFADIWGTVTQLSFTPPRGDLSVNYLVRLFGYMPGVPQFFGSTSTLLGKVFLVFNTGILGISGVFLGYTTFKVVTETAMDGSAMGKSTTVWTAVRIALSTSLLVPQAKTGYSLINSIVMWVVIQGIGLADITWSTAMDYLKEGGVITAPQQPSVDYTLVDYTLESSSSGTPGAATVSNVGSADVLRSLTCAYVFKDALAKYQASQKSNVEAQNTAKPVPTHQFLTSSIVEFVPYKEIGNYYYFPYIDGGTDSAGNNVSEQKVLYGRDSIYGLADTKKLISGKCGVIGYAVSGNQSYTEAKRRGLRTMIDMLDPIAQQFLIDFQAVGPSNIRNVNPYNYDLYRDTANTRYGFTTALSPADSVPSPSSTRTTYYNTTGTTYLTYYLNKDFDWSTVQMNWPKGLSELLSAAVAYHFALEDVRGGARKQVKEKIKQNFNDAKASGWVMAGSYYRLLQQQGDAITEEKNSFRLKGYTPNKDESTRSPDVVNSLISSEVASASNPGPSELSSFYNLSNETLIRALEWIYFSVPYTTVLGNSLISTSSQSTGTEALRKYVPSLANLQEWGIYLQLSIGAVLLAIPMAGIAGIPLLTPVPYEFLVYDIHGMIENWKHVMIDEKVGGTEIKDPIFKLQTFGTTMMNCSMDYLGQMKIFFIVTTLGFIGSTIWMTILSFALAPGSYWSITSGYSMSIETVVAIGTAVNELARSILYIMLPLGMAVVTPLFVAGITLAMYVPLIPYMLFLFGVISWIISVLVLMAASPIICFMMFWGAASQDNMILTREAEQFVLQLIAVFFRPTLMIIGLIAGMLLTYIGVDLLNAGFAKVFDISGIITDGEGTTRMCKEFGFMTIYTFIMVSIVNMCFSTIYTFHNEVMRMAGVSVAASGAEEKAMGEVKQAATQIAEAGIGGMKEQGSAKGVGFAQPRKEKLSGKKKIGAKATEDNKSNPGSGE